MTAILHVNGISLTFVPLPFYLTRIVTKSATTLPALTTSNSHPPLSTSPFSLRLHQRRTRLFQTQRLTTMSSSKVDATAVLHEPQNNRYVLKLPDVDELAFLAYNIDSNVSTGPVYDLRHTYVPAAMRGHGIAAKLVKYAVEHARQQKHKIIPSCSYIGTYMRRYPEDADVILVSNTQ